VGKPDKKSGEVPVAFVVVRPGAKPPTTNEIKDFVAAKVSEYKQLDSVVFISSIPKNVTGKILRKDLKESLTKN
jgi:acyl-coenzyme A synthetase/AMP-(fatty) acid ligase